MLLLCAPCGKPCAARECERASAVEGCAVLSCEQQPRMIPRRIIIGLGAEPHSKRRRRAALCTVDD
eukprot:scaffold5016_cov118-Isochrysis_galbana.AAC.16